MYEKLGNFIKKKVDRKVSKSKKKTKEL